MEIFIWSEKYSVHIAEIDQQHQKLISLINQLGDAMSLGKGPDVLGRILGDLVEYTVYHFSTEERLFRQHAYPQHAEHKQKHDDLTEKVKQFKKDFDAGNWMLTIDVLKFLTKWLNDHILGTDMKYAPFLNDKGVH